MDIKRYSVKSESESDHVKIAHVFDCLQYISSKLYDVYDNDKIKDKADSFAEEGSFEYDSEFLFERDSKCEHAHIFVKKISNPIVRFVIKRTRKSLYKFFTLVTEYKGLFLYDEELKKVCVRKSMGKDPNCDFMQTVFKYDINYSIDESAQFFSTREGVVFLMHLLAHSFYTNETDSYYYPETIGLSSRDEHTLLMILMSITWGNSFVIGNLQDAKINDLYNDLQTIRIIKSQERKIKQEPEEIQIVDEATQLDSAEMEADQVVIKKKPQAKTVKQLLTSKSDFQVGVEEGMKEYLNENPKAIKEGIPLKKVKEISAKATTRGAAKRVRDTNPKPVAEKKPRKQAAPRKLK